MINQREPVTQYTGTVRITRESTRDTTRHTWHAIAELTPTGRPWASIRATGEGKKPHVAAQRAFVDAFGRLP